MRLRRIIPLVIALVGVLSSVVAVSAYESHIVNVQAHVENALTTPFDEMDLGTMFPEEWLVYGVPIELSPSFMLQERVTQVTYDVWVHCKDPIFGVEWMGDAAYLAGSDPGLILPGGGGAGPIPPAANAPWNYVGGNPGDCPGGAIPGNLMQVLTGVTLTQAQPLGGVWLGLDVPVCSYNYNPDTDVKPKPSGYDVPTLVLVPGDPRYTDPLINKECEYDMGMDVKFQVVDIQ